MKYTEEVKRWQQVIITESIEVPEDLIKLVNGNDREFGRNGYNYMGCNRSKQGGATIDRLQEYINQHSHGPMSKCACPIKLAGIVYH